MTGELEDKYYIVTRGDSRIAMQIAKNKHTVLFNRESRFLIDDDDSPHKLSYILTKPLKLGTIYEGVGVYKFVLTESTATGDDNHELGIADYYKYFSKSHGDKNMSGQVAIGKNEEDDDNTKGQAPNSGKKVWF